MSSEYFTVEPKNKPEIIDTHKVKINGKWETRPGLLMVRLNMIDKEDTEPRIDNIFKNQKVLENYKIIDKEKSQNKLHDLRHKLYAVSFTGRQIQSEIFSREKKYIEEYEAASGASVMFENFTLIYETEAFLFQIKSTLDILTQFFGISFFKSINQRSFRHSGSLKTNDYVAGGKVLKAIKQIDNELYDILEKARIDWIQELTIMRDKITHYGALENFLCFIEEPFVGQEKIKIFYPKMPNDELLSDYSINTFSKLISLISKILYHLS